MRFGQRVAILTVRANRIRDHRGVVIREGGPDAVQRIGRCTDLLRRIHVTVTRISNEALRHPRGWSAHRRLP